MEPPRMTVDMDGVSRTGVASRSGVAARMAPARDGRYCGLVTRRHAILADNDQCLRERIAELRVRLPRHLTTKICAAMVIGSAAEGRAHDRSDLDLLLVLNEGSPRRGDYAWWDREVAPHVARPGPFPIHPVIVGRSALATREPNLRQALRRGLPLWNPEGVFA